MIVVDASQVETYIRADVVDPSAADVAEMERAYHGGGTIMVGLKDRNGAVEVIVRNYSLRTDRTPNVAQLQLVEATERRPGTPKE